MVPNMAPNDHRPSPPAGLDGEGLRGEGKGSFLTLAHALRLASHPVFCGSVKGIDQKANAVPTDLAIKEDGKGFTFSGKVTADPPVYGVVAYMDPDGGGAMSVRVR